METEVKNPTKKTKKTSKKKTTASIKDLKKAKEVDQKNAENVVNKITDQKDLMYKYPKEVDTLAERKKFRSTARRTKASFEKQIAKADKKERPAIKKEAMTWAEKVYTKNHIPEF